MILKVKKKSKKKSPIIKKYVNPHKGMGNNTKENIDYRRQQLITLIGSGKNTEEISKILNVSIDTIYKDKSELSKQGIETLRNLGSAELTFYYSTIIKDNNNVKKFLWSVLNADNTNTTTSNNDNKTNNEEIITIEHKLKASRTLIELNRELRELYNQSVSHIILPDYTKRLDNIETMLLEENLTQDNIHNNNKQSDKIKSFMNIKRPKLTNDNNSNDNDNIDNDNVM